MPPAGEQSEKYFTDHPHLPQMRKAPELAGQRHEIFPQIFSSNIGWRYRVARFATRRFWVRLSNAAGANRCRISPGGTTDISARLIGRWLSQRLGQQFVVENRPGAGGSIAFEMVARGTPDGYTLLVAGLPVATNAILYTNLNFNVIRDIAPVAGILRVPNVIMVNPSFPTKTLPEFIAYAKANPGMINMATAGIGSTLHIFGELFKMMVGVNLVCALSRWRRGADRPTRRTGSSNI
jgi:Tripartite tricarboxylate transporter family receptor